MDYSTSFAGECRLSVLFFKSLTAVCAVSDSYSDLAGAAICISITKKPIGHAHWVSKICDPTEIGGKTSWRATKYSCLAMLESGGCDIHPDQVELVMAMATGTPSLRRKSSSRTPFYRIIPVNGLLKVSGAFMAT